MPVTGIGKCCTYTVYLGIAQTVYSRYERGFQTIPLEHLIRLADYYQVSLDYLVGRTHCKHCSKISK